MTRTDKLVAAHWGVARVRMTDGRPALVPIAEDMRPSERMADYLAGRDGAERLLAPKVREGYLRACREGRDPALTREDRGREAFVEVEWEEALELAARAIERTYADHGPSAVWGRSYGWKNTGEVNNPIGLLRRLLMLKGGFVQTFNSYSTAAIAAIQKVIAGSGDPDVPPAAEVLEHAERVILWGADPVVTNDIAWTTTLHDTAKVFEAMRTKEGLEVVAVNPVKPETLDVTGGRWIAPLPGTDAALALGLVHTLWATGRADRHFLETRTTGFETLEACLNGRLDGVVRDAAWAADICGLDEKTIRDFAEELAAHRTMIMLGWGPQRARYGESTVWAVWALAAALGQIGGRGTGIGTRYHYSSGGAGASAGRGLPGLPVNVAPIGPVTHPERLPKPLPVAAVADVLLNPGKRIRCGGIELKYPDIRLVFWAGGNPFAHHPDTGRLAAGFRRPDAVIACDVFETATTKYADILLPASHPLERSDIAGIGGYAARGIVRSSQVFEPKGNVLSDYEIFRHLAAKLGLEGVFTEGLDEQGWQRRLYEEAVRREAAAGLELPDWDAFVKKGIVFFPEAAPGPTALERFAADPEGAPLATESGRIMLASKRVAEAGLEDCPGHPAYLGEPSKPGEYRLVSPKSAWRLHSQLDAVTRRAHNTDGCEPCWINEDDAARLGISTGDAVRLSTPRGSVRAAAVVTDRVRPGVLALHHGAWAETTEAGEREDGGVRLDCRHGAANVLVPDLPTSGWSRGNNAAAYDVRLERL